MKKLTFVVVAFLGVVGCGKEDGDNRGGKDSGESVCEYVWQKDLKRYNTIALQTYKYGKQDSPLGAKYYSEKTISVSDAEIVSEIIVYDGEKNPGKAKRKVQSKKDVCEGFRILGDDAPTLNEMKALEDAMTKQTKLIGVETISVTAGQFDATHYRFIAKDMQIDSWTIEPVEGLLVTLKSETNGVLDHEMIELEMYSDK